MLLIDETRNAWREATPVSALAYIVGLIDGEGCIYASRRSPRSTSGRSIAARMLVHVKISMTDRGPIEFVAKWFGCKVYSYLPRKEGGRGVFAIELSNAKRVRRFLEPLLPYLTGKREQAKLALRFAATFSPGRNISEADKTVRAQVWSVMRDGTHYPSGTRRRFGCPLK